MCLSKLFMSTLEEHFTSVNASINGVYGPFCHGALKLDISTLFTTCKMHINYYVAAVKSRPILHHCVVIFFWSSGIMECTCMLFTFENGVPLMR